MLTENSKTVDEAEIRELIANWEQAARAKEINGIMAHHAPDMLAFDVPTPLQFKGADAYRKHWESFFPMFEGPSIFEISELSITAGDDVAFCTCLIRCGGTQTNGDKCEGTARATLGFRKIDDQWTFTHEHHSMPMSMDGGDKAAADLKPS